MRRPTDDVDALVDYLTNQSSLSEARAALAAIGFQLSDDEQHAYRFRHEDGRKVDLMVADHLPSRMNPRLDRRPAFEAPSGEQTIQRRDIYRLEFRSGAAVEVGVPDEFGALVAKGAAWLVDWRDRERHRIEGGRRLLATHGITLARPPKIPQALGSTPRCGALRLPRLCRRRYGVAFHARISVMSWSRSAAPLNALSRSFLSVPEPTRL